MTYIKQSQKREAAEIIAKQLQTLAVEIKSKKQDISYLSDAQERQKINSLIECHNQICKALDSLNKWLLTYEGEAKTKQGYKVGPIPNDWGLIETI